MKTAISIPDKIFSEAELYAKNNGLTRSQLFALAVESYVKSNQLNSVTEKLNSIYSGSPEELDENLERLQTLSIERESW
tara:strand:- start:615 stop:851 length:237 start_codon:yes stop_codon:yes gene_type:complete